MNIKFFQSKTIVFKNKIVVLPFWIKEEVKKAFSENFFQEELLPIQFGDFKGKEGEVLLFYKDNQRILLLGLGKEITSESLRRSFASLTKFCKQKKLENLSIVFPTELPLLEEEIAVAISEGMLLANYAFKEHLNPKNVLPSLEKITFIGLSKSAFEKIESCEKIAQGVFLARDLVNGNADTITPEKLALIALELQKKCSSIKSHVLRKKEVEKEKMGLFLAVSQGASKEPALIKMEYRGASKSKEQIVIVCKGITFDTGGLLVKQRGGMEDMRSDMAGAAAGFGLIYALALLQEKINVTVVIGATENAIGPMAYKPGDVFYSMSSKSVEISDTDAEGRLVIADLMSYVKKYMKPSYVIDIATLTGAIMVALGEEVAGLFSNDHFLTEKICKAAEETYERVWHMPLINDYKEHLKSELADLKNTGTKYARAISAALFIQEFIPDCPWAHLDIAGPAFYLKERGYTPKNGTGFGVRLLVAFCQELARETQ